MKTMILAAAAALTLSTGAAFAGDGEGPAANTFFTNLPGVVAQAQVPQASSAFALNRPTAGSTAAYVTSHSGGTWLFQANGNEGANN